MAGIPYIPSTAPFTPQQRAWLNGYLVGLFADANRGEPGQASAPTNGAPEPAKTESLLILYGSQTGTAEQLAKRLGNDAAKRGFAARVMEMNAFASVDFTKEPRLIIVTSTWGDGDPPDNAAAFWQHLNSESAPRLEHLTYSVLALGDKTYSDFCGAGKKIDARLEQLGARRIHARTDCDTEYESAARAWMEGLWLAIDNVGQASRLSSGEPEGRPRDDESISRNGALGSVGTGETPVLRYNRNDPFRARLLTNRKLNAAGSAKDTRHFEISLRGSGPAYQVGDALGVMPTNCPVLVADVVRALGCDGEEAVKDPRCQETSLGQALRYSYTITRPPAPLLQAVAERSGDARLTSLLEPGNEAKLDKWLHGREVIDVLLGYPSVKFSPAEFVGFLRKLQPRLYSISSSPKAHPDEVHLTVAAVRYETNGRPRKGVCSTFLADRVDADITVPVFIQTSPGFRLPQDPERPIIMIGPGTGIAPFRAFLEERRAIGAGGKNWLFFGDQCRACDFLYREELETMLAEGTLARLDTAFSRDQEEKIYVQHRIRENAAELWAWLESGAHVYVCGDAQSMARDVDDVLHEVIQNAGTKTPEQTVEYVKKLKTEKRYQRDVY
ncbi:MAG: sulfite reductase subunit alpha [Verrucomicrobiota bacterium]